MSSPPAPLTTGSDEAPHGVTLERFAAVSAALAEGDHPLADVLAAHALTAAAWEEASRHHTRLLAADAMDGEGALAAAFSAAFARAQDALRPAPELSPEAWAELTLELAGPRGAAALAARGLGPADHLRLSRVWAARLAQDRGAAKRYFEAFYRGLPQ